MKDNDIIKAPDFCLKNQNGEDISLENFKNKWLILYFYPKDNTPGCSIEGIDFSSLKKDFNNLGAEVLGVSKDSIKSHCNFIAKKNLTIDLLSDPEHVMLDAYNAWRLKKNFGKEYFGIVRSTVIINPDGFIVYKWKNVKAKGHAEKVLEKLKLLVTR